jgi:protein TonB
MPAIRSLKYRKVSLRGCVINQKQKRIALKACATLSLMLTFLGANTTSAAAAADGWSASVARLIARNQSYPRSAQIRGEEGTTRLKISIMPDGRIAGVELAASSGSAILDREAQTVVSGIGKLPPPPAGVKNLTIPIVWRLN